MASAAMCSRSKRVKLIIIGAGMAGLSAASHLAKTGMTDFLVLEATNKIGGRIVSAQSAKHRMELGANWIHGVLGNPLYEIATANGLIDIVHTPKPHKVVAATEEGKQVPFQLLQEMYQAYVCFLRRCEEYFLCQYLPPEGINSVGEHLDLEMSMFLQRVSNQDERRLRELIFRCLLKRETCIAGCNSMADIDLLQLGSYTELQGGNIALPSGYSSILEPISHHIPPNLILKKHPVETIRWNFSEERCASGSANITNDWGSESCDSDDSDVTVTGDVPKIPSTHSSHEPSCEKDCSVSEDKIEAGASSDNAPKVEPHPGGGEKQLLGSSKDNIKVKPRKRRKNNHRNLPNVQVVCEDGSIFYADHVICTIPLGVLKEKSARLFSPALPAYKLESINKLLFGTVNKIFLEYDRPFLNPEVSEVMLLWNNDETLEKEGDIKENWFHKIYSFSKVTDTLLLAWISGKEAEYMETLSHDAVAEICTFILRKFLNDPFVPKPKCCVFTTWGSQPYTRGSYTSIAVGASQDDIENVAQPLYSNDQQVKPVVLFAGEHTHSSFYSTVHGAYLTGRSAAQIVIQPETPEELVLECDEDTSDLSAWIQSISLQ